MRVAELDKVGRPVPKATGTPGGVPIQPTIEGVPEVYRRKKTALRGPSAFGSRASKLGRIFICDTSKVISVTCPRQANYERIFVM